MLAEGAERPTELRRVSRVLRVHVWLIVATTVAFAGAAYGLSAVQSPRYRATAQVVITPQKAAGVFGSDSAAYRDPSRAVQTEVRVILGRAVEQAVRKEISDPASIDARAVGMTDAIDITAESTDPDRAAASANAYAKAYMGYRQDQAVETLSRAEAGIRNKVKDLQSQIDELDDSISAVGGFDLKGLATRRDALISQQALFNQRLDEILVDASLQDDGVELVFPASVPSEPFSPKPLRNTLFGGIAGLFVGIAAAFILDRLDESIKTKADAERAVRDVPVLASVPITPKHDDADERTVAALARPDSPAVEAYRSLRTAVRFEALHRQLSVIQVTSPMAAEGKSTTVANLAVTFAEAGERVVVVCCDLRRPRIHEFFGLENTTGFSSTLLEQIDPEEASQPVPAHPNLAVLSAGPLPPNPSELLSSSAAEKVLAQLRNLADIVLIDCPPVLPVTDASILAQYVDATLLVVAAGKSTSSHVVEAVSRLRSVDAPLLGMVLNGVRESSRYDAKYSYGADQGSGSRRGLKKLVN